MKDELFNELIESVRQGGAILRGKAALSRAFEVSKNSEAISCMFKTAAEDHKDASSRSALLSMTQPRADD
jgi:hypothetical protein